MSVTSPETDRHVTRRRAESHGGRPVRIDREGPGGILPFDVRKPTPGLTGSEIAALRDRLPTLERGSGGTADDEGTPVTDAARPDALAATPPGLETRDPGASPLVPLPPRARDLAGPRRDGFAGWDCLASRIRFSGPASFLAPRTFWPARRPTRAGSNSRPVHGPAEIPG
ncbi:hypothetical protein SAMN05444336_108124 [Albimonas donghaensis]|uniref:Uncharacterized protein n=1 Tax=Albimonas donghaensis TaxID=356660 RepID=A0A1H3DUE8_9RHOB|nr:hypothetical protein SAMN05444336_108124 [Albimonas donghaensis]